MKRNARRYPTWLSELAWAGTIATFVIAPQILKRALGDEEKPTKIRAKPPKDRPTSGLVVDEDDDVEPPPDGLEFDDRPPCQLPKRRPGAPQAIGLEGAESDLGGQDEGFCIPPADLEPEAATEVPFAVGPDRPQWPLATDDEAKIRVSYKDVRGKFHGKWGRHFGTARAQSGRVHVGVDLGADPGDLVIAAEDGVVDAILPFLVRKDDAGNVIERTWGVYVRNASGLLMNYGEVKENSWGEFGLERGVDLGKPVVAGQPLARVSGTKMLHLETMRPETSIGQIRREELQWKKGDPAPPEILDPTRYLVRAWKNKYDQLLGKES